MDKLKYDVIVVGAGHAGCEAAAAAGNLGSKVLLVTMDMTKIGQMSCNPAMGGIAKGQIVREIDALGGQAGIITDKSLIQFRMLNKSKGPAMWSPRAQCDRTEFGIEWRKCLEEIKGIDIWQDFVVRLLIKNKKVIGVVTKLGVEFLAKCVILTNGTFGNGLIHIGRNRQSGGRVSEPISIGITEQLSEFGFTTGRMKTGTPARLDGRSINFTELEAQPGDTEGGCFSFISDRNEVASRNSRSCHITYTNPEVHEILARGFKDSPLYNGTISSVGPRYCPSIEDKIVTFSKRTSHQLFLEPEGNRTIEYYLNGFSSSLPYDIQYMAIKKIKGLENVKLFRPGYAIEYDYYDPIQLKLTLETKLIKNLFFAGQINGTTGYEEAGCQGLIAGINAHLLINEHGDFILRRDQAYIGVLIDDLVNKGVDEPYRMFTSRAEFRMLLRQDNADERLTEMGYRIGIVKKDRIDIFKKKWKVVDELKQYLTSSSVTPSEINPKLLTLGTSGIKQKCNLIELLDRPQISIRDLINKESKVILELTRECLDFESICDFLENEIKYKGYVGREKIIADKMTRLENLTIRENINYSSIDSLSTEAKQKLKRIQPKTIGQAARVPGVSPADINVLLVHMGR
jgi:tRNA uridine 5-carboxymethylaminomethyl modification enzyme